MTEDEQKTELLAQAEEKWKWLAEHPTSTEATLCPEAEEVLNGLVERNSHQFGIIKEVTVVLGVAWRRDD